MQQNNDVSLNIEQGASGMFKPIFNISPGGSQKNIAHIKNGQK